MRRTYAQIDLNTLRENIKKIKAIIGPKVRLMGVVKADGYGHGAALASKILEEEGASYLGVAWAEEGIVLRKNGINLPILVLSEQDDDAIQDIVEYNLSQTIYSYDFARKLSLYCENIRKTIKVHIKIDSGMGRIGIKPEEAKELAMKVKNMPGLEIEGIFTHFARADEPDSDYTSKQFELFLEKAMEIKQDVIDVLYLHAANSAAVVNFPKTHLDMVRVGIAMYKNVLQFKSKVAFIKEVEAGSSLGYGGTYVARNRTKIATIPIGYADGYSRFLSNQGEVLIRGKKYPIAGIVSMDMILIDIDHDEFIKVGDEAVLIGHSQDAFISAEEIAKKCKTIDYEVLCGIGKRVPRYYSDELLSDRILSESVITKEID